MNATEAPRNDRAEGLLSGEDLELDMPKPPSEFESFQREMMRQIASTFSHGRAPGSKDSDE